MFRVLGRISMASSGAKQANHNIGVLKNCS